MDLARRCRILLAFVLLVVLGNRTSAAGSRAAGHIGATPQDCHVASVERTRDICVVIQNGVLLPDGVSPCGTDIPDDIPGRFDETRAEVQSRGCS